MKFDLDPTLSRVVILGVLLFFESLLGGILVVLQEGSMPSLIQLVTVLCVAALQIITYFITFLRQEEKEQEEDTND